MDIQTIRNLLGGKDVSYKNGRIFVDNGTDYGESFKKGFMVWICDGIGIGIDH